VALLEADNVSGAQQLEAVKTLLRAESTQRRKVEVRARRPLPLPVRSDKKQTTYARSCCVCAGGALAAARGRSSRARSRDAQTARGEGACGAGCKAEFGAGARGTARARVWRARWPVSRPRAHLRAVRASSRVCRASSFAPAKPTRASSSVFAKSGAESARRWVATTRACVRARVGSRAVRVLLLLLLLLTTRPSPQLLTQVRRLEAALQESRAEASALADQVQAAKCNSCEGVHACARSRNCAACSAR
jgi:hypothetical protein